MDFLGTDGSEAGVVDTAHDIGTVITCEACHNDATTGLTSVSMPSGVEIGDLGPSARCMECHQGRASAATVDGSIEEAGLTGDPDTVSEDLGFINIHYYAAAASLFGSETMGGYQYEGNNYQIRFAHVEDYQECVDCHDSHTLELAVDECVACHDNVTEDSLQDIRMQGSLADYDGDGDISEGVYYEIVGLQETLYGAIQAYAADVAGTAVVYDSHAYPYFFIDTNEDGESSEDEAIFPNQYNAWTPRLLKAAYNYQVSLKDPGAYAHNAKYHIALLYDSIADLNESLSSPVDLSAAHRNDPGHFDGTAEAFRHWDADDPAVVPGRCSKCHSSEGLPLHLAEGVSISQEPANSLMCTTCHSDQGGDWPRFVANDATFPSGATVTFGEAAESNLCIQCHQGRSSTVSVDGALAGKPDDTPDENIRFLNIHYFAAAATVFGTETQGAYQYAGQTYVGVNEHVNGFNECTECHNVHELAPVVEDCAECHDNEDPSTYREDETDWDGDGDVTEGVAGEIATMTEVLYAAILQYGQDSGTPIVYESHNYPYFFLDTNADGVATPDEAIYPNQYNSWTPRLLRAAYNYQYAKKDPGAFAHNAKYVMQVIYDSIADIGGDVSGMTRP